MPGLVTIQVRDDFDKLAARMTDIEQRQIPFAMSQAANRLAKLGVKALQDEMQRVFDKPTRWVYVETTVDEWLAKNAKANGRARTS